MSSAEGQPLFVVTTSFDIADFDAQFFQLKEKLAEFGEIISTSPAVDEQHSDRINFRVLYAGDGEAQDIAPKISDLSGVTFEEIENAGPASFLQVRQLPRSSRSNFVRADLDKLDLLISSTHALLRNTTEALDLALAQQLPKAAHTELGTS